MTKTDTAQSVRAGDGNLPPLPAPTWLELDTPGADFDTTFCATVAEARDTIGLYGDDPLPESTRHLYTADQMRAYALAAAPAAETGWRGLTEQERAAFVNEICEYGTGFVAPLFSLAESLENVLKARNSAAAPAVSAPAWLPIETAPLNDLVLLHSATRGNTHPTLGRWRDYHGINQPRFSHWAPIPAVTSVQAPVTAPTDDPDDLTHRFYEVRQDREMLAQALRAVLDNPTEEAKQHARLALGDRSHG